MRLTLTPWRLLVDGAHDQLSQALLVELGPHRASTVAVATGPGQVNVIVEGPDPDRWGTVWVTVVEFAALWEHDVFQGDQADLVVDVHGLRVETAHDAMVEVAGGAGFEQWRAAINHRPRVRAV